MPPVMQPVYSSNVDSVGYDEATREMYVAWTGGKTSVYSGVPPGLAGDATKAYSVGAFLNENVKGRYEHKYLPT
jgi:KTSC domain